jgi:hypothetical protein
MTFSTSFDKLSEARKAFDSWRTTRSGKSHIPDNLWQMAVQLLDSYPISHIVRELRLNQTQLRKRQRAILQTQLVKNNVKQKTLFLELNQFLPASQASSDADSSTLELLIERKDGARLTLSLNSSQAEMIQNLVTAFIQS